MLKLAIFQLLEQMLVSSPAIPNRYTDFATEILRPRSRDGDLATEILRRRSCYRNRATKTHTVTPIKTRFFLAFGHFFVKQKRNEFRLRVCLGTQQPLLAPKPRLSDRTLGEMRGMRNTRKAGVTERGTHEAVSSFSRGNILLPAKPTTCTR